MVWAPRRKNQGLTRACKVFEWIENHLVIAVKQPVLYVDTKGNRRSTRVIPFRFNEIQMLLAEFVADRWGKKLPVKAFTPKSRQLGSSTFWQGIMFALCVLDDGYQVATVAHTEAGAADVFKRTHTFHRNLPKGWEQHFVSRQGGRLEWERGSASWIGAASEGDSLSRGPTLNAIHFSESASFSDRGQDPDAPVTAARGALAEGPDAIEIHESTAKGRDAFFFEGCEAAKDPEGDSEFSLIFLPWFLDQTYTMRWKDYRNRLIHSGKKDPGEDFHATEEELLLQRRLSEVLVRESERWWRYQHLLTEDQLVWRRFTLHNKYAGKLSRFQRAFPSTYEEAFTSTIQCLFDDATCAHYLRKSKSPEAVGNLIDVDGGAFMPNARGHTKIWEFPTPGEEYVVGADPGGSRRGADFCAATVLNSYSMEVVAVIHGHLEWDDFVKALYQVGRFYNWALLVVERNFNPAVASSLAREHGYPNMYYYVDAAALRGAPTLPGYNTNKRTREELVSHLDRATRHKEITHPDVGFAREMPKFIWDDRKHHYAAQGKDHDDRIMATALAISQSKGKDPMVREVAKPKHSRSYARFLEIQEEKTESVAGPAGVLYL